MFSSPEEDEALGGPVRISIQDSTLAGWQAVRAG
jgi:hypothetical protein